MFKKADIIVGMSMHSKIVRVVQENSHFFDKTTYFFKGFAKHTQATQASLNRKIKLLV